MKTIKGDNFIARYDDEKQVIHGIYGAEATGETTALMYMAISKFMREIDLNHLQGIEFDLRRIETFARDNMSSMQRESFQLNKRYDMSRIPVCFVVHTKMQEQMAYHVIQITPNKDRSDIVFSTAEAHAYFAEWHDYNDARA